MRIAHVITRLILGGAQENTLLTCEGLLHDYGDQVLLVTGPPLGPEGSLMQRARHRGVPLALLPELRREIHPLRDWQSYQSIRRELRNFAPDVVHTHSGKAGLLGRMAATSLGVPAIVHTVHGAPFHPYQNFLARSFFKRCEKFAAARCDLLVSVADAMTEQLVAAGVAPRDKFATVYSGMEVEPYLQSDDLREATRRKLGFNARDVVVTKVARIFRLKGHDDFVQAAALVLEQHPQSRFLIVGDGVLSDQVKEQIARLGLEPYFHFTGLVPPEVIPAMLAASDIVAHASLREGLARALPQALLAGKPVVSYDVDGAREVVLPGETGYLVPPRDTNALARAIGQLVAEPTLRDNMGSTGRARFAKQFDHRQMTFQLRELYEQLLAAKRQG
jgi:glycosyltransferase involved in cell wall biosynthesis